MSKCYKIVIIILIVMANFFLFIFLITKLNNLFKINKFFGKIYEKEFCFDINDCTK